MGGSVERLGVELPSDWRAFVERYGHVQYHGDLAVVTPALGSGCRATMDWCELTEWIERLVAARTGDHRSDPDSALAAPPGLRPPAGASRIAELEGWLRQPIEPGYREFLEFSDGMDNFRSGMPLLGWRDWPSGDTLSRALRFLDTITGIDVHVDEGLSEDAVLAPVLVNGDGTVGIFMVWDEESPEKRYFWVGNGDAAFFSTLSEVFDVASGVRSWSDFSTE